MIIFLYFSCSSSIAVVKPVVHCYVKNMKYNSYVHVGITDHGIRRALNVGRWTEKGSLFLVSL
jgi:hypothetical protein